MNTTQGFKILFLSLIFGIFSLQLQAFEAERFDAEALDPEFIEFFSMIYQDPLDEASDRLQELAQKLHIQEDQASAWEGFAAMITENMAQKQQHHQQMKEKLKGRVRSISAPEMLEIHLQNLQFQRGEAERALMAMQPLYQVLYPDQKRALDKVMKHLWGKGKRR